MMKRKDWMIGRLLVTRYPLHRDKIWGVSFGRNYYTRKGSWEVAFGSHLYYVRFDDR